MTANQKSEMYNRIREHGQQLLAIFPNATERDPVALCKKLRRAEHVAHRLAEACCEYLSTESKEFTRRYEAAILRVGRILGPGGPPVFINLDPRGYALKIESEAARDLDIRKDWGGYGIIAPDLSPQS